ncbi:MAG TPA: ribokinase [Aliidongia sp.]|nr:ribokinase [Aliidongia sp.]
MILVFGSINMDLIARVRNIAQPGQTVLAERYHTAFGGKGANQAVAAARALKDRGRVAMAGAVGDDAFGRNALDNLAAQGIDTNAIAIGPEPTGCAFIAVDDAGENAITVVSGANRMVKVADVHDDLLKKASLLVLQMEVPARENLALAVRAKRCGVRVLLNLAPADGDLTTDLLAALLADTDILVANEQEAVAAHGLLGEIAVEDAVGAMTVIATTRALVGVVTLGARGAIAIFPDGTIRHAAARPVVAVDTTGAGDTFVGILAAGLAEARPFGEALARACGGASLACLALGAQDGMPDATLLDEFSDPVLVADRPLC